MASISSIFGPPKKTVRKPSAMAAKLAASAPPDDPAEESGEDEGGETCSADISSDELQELQTGGTVTITADDGEKVVLTLKEAGDDQSDEGTAPEGM